MHAEGAVSKVTDLLVAQGRRPGRSWTTPQARRQELAASTDLQEGRVDDGHDGLGHAVQHEVQELLCNPQPPTMAPPRSQQGSAVSRAAGICAEKEALGGMNAD